MCLVVIFMGIDATTWISAMDDAKWEVPVIFSYGASTLQSFVPDTYKSTRPCYANVWADYASAGGQAMLDDMMDALSYCPDIAEDVRLSYRDNNYCVAGYLYGMTIVKAFERLNEMQDDYGLNWDDFSAVMEMGDFEMGAVTFDFANGKRMGVDAMALLEYVGDPATGNEEMVNLLPFADLDTVLSK